MTMANENNEIIFHEIDQKEGRWLKRVFTDETWGGVFLIVAAILAFGFANSLMSEWYDSFINTKVGPESIGLRMSVSHWAADGFLAIFFLVAGLELKHELVHGSLSKPRQALVPITAAIAGVLVPAAIFVFLLRDTPEYLVGWAIPIATDIAFALAVLAVAGKHLPAALRAFLLTLAVVDDLVAITVIAVFYTSDLNQGLLLLTVGLLALYAVLQKLNFTRWYFLVPLGFMIWWATYQSGIHATVAGVAIALLTRNQTFKNEKKAPADIAEHLVRPISVAIAIPFFAFTAAGVDVRGLSIAEARSGISLAVVLALFIGKPIGILLSTYLITKFTRAHLSENLTWSDVAAAGFLAGIGFTVSLLIGELSFAPGTDENAAAKIGILLASILSGAVAVLLMQGRRLREKKKNKVKS
ncbi:MAG: Na+/H+ antiporter NhaA [Candidatus Nanopelagicales bacterium]